MVMFDQETEFPPVTQTVSLDVGTGFVSKGAMLPFPVITLTVPVS